MIALTLNPTAPSSPHTPPDLIQRAVAVKQLFEELELDSDDSGGVDIGELSEGLGDFGIVLTEKQVRRWLAWMIQGLS